MNSPSKRLAIFGGTFDPPHKAHCKLLEQVQSQFKFDQVYVVPSKYPPGKQPIADYETRLRWVNKLFTGLDGIEVKDVEGSSSSTTFGSEIWNRLSLVDPSAEFHWILGEDQWEQLSYWKAADSYAKELIWVVMPRDPELSQRDSGVLSRRLLGSSCSYYWAAVDRMPELSSSEIRDHIDEDHIADWIPDEIRDEVKEFYQNTNNKSHTGGNR